MSPERRAILLLVGLAVAGHGARAALAPRHTPPGAITILGARSAHAALARRDSLAQLARPLAEGERVDPDRAGPAELGRLPGVGPGLARRIVEDREQHGPFDSLAGLDRVSGIGPRLLERLAPHLSFAGRAAVWDTGGKRDQRVAGRRGVATTPEPSTRLLLRQRAPKGILSEDPRPGPPTAAPAVQDAQIVLNSGSVSDLDRLPGIGPTRARRIVQFRDSAGPFRGAEDLARVPGISLALARRLWSGLGAP